MDDIQQSIMKAQKAKRNKNKKLKKRQRKVEKEVDEVSDHPNPVIGLILKSFTAEENSPEMLQAVKAVHQSPILGEVLLQLYLRLKESQNETCKAQLGEQEMLTLLKLKDLELAEKDGEILDLQSHIALLKLPPKTSNKAVTANLMQEEAKRRDSAT
jgi:hypothetical protein